VERLGARSISFRSPVPSAILRRGGYAADRAIAGKSHAAGYVNPAEVIA